MSAIVNEMPERLPKVVGNHRRPPLRALRDGLSLIRASDTPPPRNLGTQAGSIEECTG